MEAIQGKEGISGRGEMNEGIVHLYRGEVGVFVGQYDQIVGLHVH